MASFISMSYQVTDVIRSLKHNVVHLSIIIGTLWAFFLINAKIFCPTKLSRKLQRYTNPSYSDRFGSHVTWAARTNQNASEIVSNRHKQRSLASHFPASSQDDAFNVHPRNNLCLVWKHTEKIEINR